MSEVLNLIKKTYNAAPALRAIEDRELKKILLMLADELEAQQKTILKANKKDVANQKPGDPKADRLKLDEKRIKNISNSIRKVSRLPNPSDKIIERKKLPNGLLLEKRTVPLGVVGAVFESRPNVTFDIAALCLRSGNACVLKGSSDAAQTNLAAIQLIHLSLIHI